MATISGAELEKMLNHYETVSGPFQSKPRKQSKRNRADSMRLIIEYVQRSGEPVTRRQIAEYLAVSKSPWILQQIRDLAALGYIVEIVSRCPNGMPRMLYTVH